MKKLTIPLILMGLFLQSNIQADECCPKKVTVCENTCTEDDNSRLQIGANYTHIQMKPQGQSEFNGNLGGLQGIYEYRPVNDFYAAALLRWKLGNMEASNGKRDVLYVDVQERFGYTFSFCQNHDKRLSLYTGFGYRHLGENFHPKTGHSVQFNYNEFFIPVGALSDYKITSWLNIGFGVTWMPQVFPTVSIVPLKGNNWDLTKQLSNFYVEMPFTFNLTCDERFTVQVTPFYERWNDGHSTAVTAAGNPLGLPGNQYNFFGLDLNLGYSF